MCPLYQYSFHDSCPIYYLILSFSSSMTILMTPSNKHLISCFILYREKDIKQTKKIDGMTNECKM